LIYKLVNSTEKIKPSKLFMVAKAGLVVPFIGMSLRTDGSLISRALKSCYTGVLHNGLVRIFFVLT